MPIVYLASADFDTATVKRGRKTFEHLATLNDDVIIDMTGVVVMDGAGLGALVFSFKRLRANGHTLRLRNVGGQPLRVLREMRLLELLGVGANPEIPTASFADLPGIPLLATGPEERPSA